MLDKIDKAIAMYEARLNTAVEDAGHFDGRPNAGLISQIHNDLLVLYVMRKDEARKAELVSRGEPKPAGHPQNKRKESA